ncbi:hypothetical protein ABT010_17690 [Streptomyces sp. NPDC002668]|uniref:hypothetical protein n=1 Tax=Streptomyces sp. NPDC002668 TaxID=3154422 RepID=UPI00332D6B2C
MTDRKELVPQTGARVVAKQVTRGIGCYGVLTTLGAAFSVDLFIEGMAGALQFFVLLVFVAGAARMIWLWRYRPKLRIKDLGETTDELVRSGVRYCLILRAFGSDGYILVRSSRRRRSVSLGGMKVMSTMEQIVNRAWFDTSACETYAVVAPHLFLAPGGPVYMKANDNWMQPVEKLIEQAHSVVLIIPPRQEIRASSWWEIRKVVETQRLERLTVVIPPYDQKRGGYPKARRELCKIMTVLEDPLCLAGLPDGSDPQISEDRVAFYDEKLPPRMLGVHFFRNEQLSYEPSDEGPVRPHFSYVATVEKTFLLRRRRKVTEFSYRELLLSAFESDGREGR